MTRENINLDGQWGFKLDPQREGFRDGWFLRDVELKNRIQVPGCWQAQGYGEPGGSIPVGKGSRLADYLSANYEGLAWYQKSTSIPDSWQGKRVWLLIGGAIRYCNIFVNGVYKTSHLGFSTPFKVDVTDLVQPGELNDVRFSVDNHPSPYLYLVGCLNYSGNWGGLYRGVSLETTSDPWVDSIFVIPKVRPKQVTVRVEICSHQEAGDFEAIVEVTTLDDEIRSKSSTTINILPRRTEILELNIPLPGSRLWHVDDPFLHKITVRLMRRDGEIDSLTDRFGLREIRLDGHRILLNGSPIFIAGWGDNVCEPVTGVPPCDKKVYYNRLLTMKSLGFNAARHHSWCPYPEYLEAADEVGVLIQPEAPLVYFSTFVDGEGFSLAAEEWKRMLRTHRNHPCILTWCMSNEFSGPAAQGLLKSWYYAAKELDSTRPVVVTSGGKIEPSDVYISRPSLPGFPQGDSEKCRKELAIQPPVIGHELGLYGCSLPDFEEIPRIKGAYRSLPLESNRDRVAKMNLLDIYPRYLHNSRVLLNARRKKHMESARLLGLQGYYYWTGHDDAEYPEGMWLQGVTNQFWEPKDCTPEEMKNYNAQTVLVSDLGEADQTRWHDEPRTMQILVSYYGNGKLDQAEIKWCIDGITSVETLGTLGPIIQEPGNTIAWGAITVPPSTASVMEKYEVRVELYNKGCLLATNAWPIWSFPRIDNASIAGKIALYASQAELLRVILNRYPYCQVVETLNENEILIVRKLDSNLISKIERGGRIIVLDDLTSAGRWPAAYGVWGNSFGTNYGTLIENHPALEGFLHEGYCYLQFQGLLDGAGWFVLDELADEILPIISAVSTEGGNHPAKAIHYLGSLMEFRIGEGYVLLTTFNALSERPESAFFLDRLLRYTCGPHFTPERKVARALVEELFKPKEGTQNGK